MTERERLIELIVNAENEVFRAFPYTNSTKRIEMVADFLLENGVIVPPVKVGQSIWTSENFTDNVPREGYITVIEYDCNGSYEFWTSFGEIPLSAEFSCEEIGKTVFLSREEAEKALKESEDNA